MLSRILVLLLIFSNSMLIAGVKPGIDVLVERNFEPVRGKKVALLSNFAGRDSKGKLTAEILASSDELELDAILAPEHGFFTTVPAGLAVNDSKIFGVPVKSLYGEKKEPNTRYISSLDAVIIDMQDIGVRSYTYLSTMYNTMYVAALSGTKVIVLDRPNPLGGLIVDGNVLDTAYRSFVGIIPVPYIHGCTFGELAYMINEENWLPSSYGRQLKCDLTIIAMENWERWMHWEDTGMQWYPTSPHIPTTNSIRGIAMLGVFGELGIVSVGVGTTLPFQYIGSNAFKYDELFEAIKHCEIQGVRIEPTMFRPFYGMYSGKDVAGIYLSFEPDNSFTPYTSGIRLMFEIKKHHPQLFERDSLSSKAINMFNKVTGGYKVFNDFFGGADLKTLLLTANEGLLDFLTFREKYLLY